MFGRKLRHLARAQQHHRAPFQVFEDFARQFDGDEADRYRARSDARFVAHALGDGEGAVHQPGQLVTHDGGLLRAMERLFDLPRDLRLAHDHRIQRRRDAEDVFDRGRAREVVKMFAHRRKVVLVEAAQEIVEARNGVLRRVGSLRGRGDQFDAIASGDDQPLADHFTVNQFAQRARESRFGERQTFAHLDRGSFMTGSDYNYAHTIREWGVGSGEWGWEWVKTHSHPHSPLPTIRTRGSLPARARRARSELRPRSLLSTSKPRGGRASRRSPGNGWGRDKRSR